MSDQTYQTTTNRNRGIISEEQQAALRDSLVVVAGCGAGGGASAVSLARLGVRHFRLADPDTIEATNINRQEGAFHSTIGQNKAEVIKNIILDIDPNSVVETYPEGINEANIEQFLTGAKLVLEEIDYRKPQYTLLVHQTARKLSIPLFTSIPIAWNAFLFYFDPKGMTYEEYTGIDPTSDFRSSDVKITAYVPEPPDYLSRETYLEVLSERMDIPAIDSGVRLATALMSAYCTYYLTGSKELLPVPHYYSAGDLLQKDASIVDAETAAAIEAHFTAGT